jgi:phosphoribosyl 1,2-cyclic phosphodiesterase
MKVTFYGTRGSIAAPGPEYTYVGGNTTCVLLTFSDGTVGILDAGTGIRKLGDDLIRSGHEQYDNIMIGLTHTHWDHIEGFRFFKPAYDPRRHFQLITCGQGRTRSELRDALSLQMQQYYFPVLFEEMGAHFTFSQTRGNRGVTPSGIKIAALSINHPVTTYSYRIEHEGKTLVLCTDVEHTDGIDTRVVDFARNVDLLIHDAQFTPDQMELKKGWGHSSWDQAVEVAEKAGVKKLALFHHDPDHTDSLLLQIEAEAQKRFPMAFLAREGMEVVL